MTRQAKKSVGIDIRVLFSGEVPQYTLAILVGNDVIRANRYFAAAAGRINDKGRHGIAGSMATELFHDFDAGRNGGTEMLGTFDRIALINIVRPDTDLQEFVHELLHRGRIVINAAQ